jgi:lipopolysaccharide cholinephosphotransferase
MERAVGDAKTGLAAAGATRSGSSTPRDLQLAELEILKEFKRMCERHSLRYFLAYGSLLGAIRHQGFVPWDDDIDVAMPRTDYERFSALACSELDERYSWQTYLTDPHYPYMFGKLVRNGTELRQRPTEHLRMQQGIHIDVFPLEGIPNRAVPRIIQRLAVRMCQIRLGADMTHSLLKRVLLKAVKVVPRTWAVNRYEGMARHFRYDDSKVTLSPAGPYGYHRESVPRYWLGDGEQLQFEDIEALGPKRWHDYLTHVYGDYMQWPPEEERRSHHQMTSYRLAPGEDGS